MELSKMTKIEVMESHVEANKYLALGWLWVSFYLTAGFSPYPGAVNSVPHYVLGWPGDNPQYPVPVEDTEDIPLPVTP